MLSSLDPVNTSVLPTSLKQAVDLIADGNTKSIFWSRDQLGQLRISVSAGLGNRKGDSTASNA